MSQRHRGGGGRKRSSSQRRLEEEGDEETMETTPQTQGDIGMPTQTHRARRAFSGLAQETIDRKVGEIVRYLLCAEKRKEPVKKKELIDKVVGAELSSCFPCLLPLVQRKLSDVFGVSVEEVVPTRYKSDGSKQPTTVRYYILTNQISAPGAAALLPCSQQQREEKGLLTVILSMIMLKDGSVQEDHLWNLLTRLGIEGSSPHHPLFGDVHNLIRKDFVDAKYLERDKITAGDQYRYVYRWGPRAEVCVDKRKLLALVAELHGSSVTQWEKQFAHILPPQN